MNKNLDNILNFAGNVLIIGFFCAGIWFKDWSLWTLLIPTMFDFSLSKEL